MQSPLPVKWVRQNPKRPAPAERRLILVLRSNAASSVAAEILCGSYHQTSGSLAVSCLHNSLGLSVGQRRLRSGSAECAADACQCLRSISNRIKPRTGGQTNTNRPARPRHGHADGPCRVDGDGREPGRRADAGAHGSL